MSTFEFDDNLHIQRLTGKLHSPGGTPGDVPTVQAGGSLLLAPGGGSQIVSCVAQAGGAIDLHAGNLAFFVWDALVDNLIDSNPLVAFPAGIGFDDAGVGTDTLTTTTEGVWAFGLYNIAIPADATWSGQLVFGNSFDNALELPVVATGTRPVPHPCRVVTLPAGTGFSVGVTTIDQSTADPMNVGGPNLQIVRIA